MVGCSPVRFDNTAQTFVSGDKGKGQDAHNGSGLFLF